MRLLSEVARRPWVRHLALGLFALYVFVLAAVAIGVGSGEVTFGATVWSQPRWVLGEPAALRVAPRDPSRRGAFIPGFSAEVFLTPPGQAPRTLGQLDSGHSAQSLRVAVPADLPVGTARLEVRLSRGEQGDVAAADVEETGGRLGDIAGYRVHLRLAMTANTARITLMVGQYQFERVDCDLSP